MFNCLMNNDFDGKIIDFSKKSKISEDTQKRFKGFPYIKLRKDENGNFFKEDSIVEYAKKCFYIVSVIKSDSFSSALYKYKVPYDSLLDFLNDFRTNASYGKVIDIERYVPEDLA